MELTDIQPSLHQATILEWIRHGTGHGMVRAVAGSGKTTTLLMAAEAIGTSDALLCAFNKHVADELAARLGGRLKCKTSYALGFSALRNARGEFEVQDKKYGALATPLVQEILPEIATHREKQLRAMQRELGQGPGDRGKREALESIIEDLRDALFKQLFRGLVDLARLARLTLTPVVQQESAEQLGARYGISLDPVEWPFLHGALRSLLQQGEQAADQSRVIDFEDMVFLPHYWKLPLPRRYQWVLVDECQDLSSAQLEIVMKAVAPGGRLLFVGDPRQAIYGFAGADPGSYARIRDRVQATEFPLSVSFRCPLSVVKVAQDIVPEITARDGAPEGSVEQLSPALLASRLREGDLVLSRKTAPLVELCLELLGRRIKAAVKGREIGADLVDLAKVIGDLRGFRFAKFDEYLQLHTRAEIERVRRAPDHEEALQRVLDRSNALAACYGASEASDLEGLAREIEELFDDGRAPITLSTVHRAKGLERERVFIIRPEDLPLIWDNQQPWQLDQEMNLKYVALTRARSALYTVPSVAAEVAEARPAVEAMAGKLVGGGVAASSQALGYGAGDRVHHTTFGKGQILEVLNDDIVSVDFGGTRRLLSVRKAPMTRIGG